MLAGVPGTQPSLQGMLKYLQLMTWCYIYGFLRSASFDGRVSVYSMMGGQQQVQPNTRVADSFGPGLGDIPGQNVPTPQVTMQLKSPPKWLRRPCGASFGFGGKLVTCETGKTSHLTNQNTFHPDV